MRSTRIALGLMCAVLLCGCGASMPEMSDDEMNAIGEYAAVTLLKYDANSKSRLVDLSKYPEKEEIVVEESTSVPETSEVIPETSQQSAPVIDNTQGGTVAKSLQEFLQLPDGMELSVIGYDLMQSYQEPGNLYFAIEAAEGKTLMAVRFKLANGSATEQSLRLIDLTNSYRVSVNGTYNRTALTTMLDNDITTYVGTVAAGEAKELVMLVEVDQEIAAAIDSVTLNIKNVQETYTIQVE